MAKDPEDKLPVPAAWQSAVRAARAEVVQATGLSPTGIALTRVDEDPAGGLNVWFLARARTWRCRVRVVDGVPEVVGLS